MKKKVIAFVCMLAILVSVFTVAVTQANATEGTYQVGYARMDINPYIDPTLEGEAKFAQSNIMSLPLRGSGDVWNRLASDGLINDNGDTVIDEHDGLSATCVAITDGNNNTILMITADLYDSELIDQVRAEVVKKVNEQFGAGTICVDEIYYTGTHTNEAPDTTAYSASNDPFDGLDKNGNVDADETVDVDKSAIHAQLGVWIDRTIENIGKAAVTAMTDRAAATLSKDMIDAGESATAAGRTMNSNRHYDSDSTDDGEISSTNYFFDENTNTRINGTADNHVQQVTEADDTIQLLQFSFGDSEDKLPVVISTWAGQPSLNNREMQSEAGAILSSKKGYSSDYVNAFRYALEYGKYEKVTGSFSDQTRACRVAFFQGAAGNVSTIGYEWNADVDTNNDDKKGELAFKWIQNLAKETEESWGSVYGRVLGQIANEGLADGVTATETGDVRTYQKFYWVNSNTEVDQTSYRAAFAADAYYSYSGTISGLFKYPGEVEEKIVGIESTLKANGLSEADYNQIVAWAQEDTAAGNYYNIATRAHVRRLINRWDTTANNGEGGAKESTIIKLELNAFALGKDVAFVTTPGEAFDFYYADTNLTGAERYADSNNLWNVLAVDGEGTAEAWGTPVILGYCNGNPSFIPNYYSYDYNEGSTDWAVGAYEVHNSSIAQGTGEAMVLQLDTMLESITDDTAYADLYPTAICEHCGEEAGWKPYSGQTVAGHYYMHENITANQIELDAGSNVCLDLKGYTVASDRRAFYADNGAGITLNIMDSSENQTGIVRGNGSPNGAASGWGGGAVLVGNTCTLNLHGGTLRHTPKEGYSVRIGGTLRVRGTFNMYGGTVEGGQVTSHQGYAIKEVEGVDTNAATNASGIGSAIALTGTMNMYGGTVTAGTSNIITGTVTGESAEDFVYTWAWSDTVENSKYAPYAPCVWVDKTGTLNLLDLEEDGVVASSSIANVYFEDADAANNLNVKGNYQGTVELSNIGDITFGKVIGGAVADESSQAADVTNAAITFEDDADKKAAVRGDDLVIAHFTDTFVTCSMCKEKCQWLPMSMLDPEKADDMEPGGHYILAEDFATVQKELNEYGTKAGTYCVDLAGNTVTGESRAFYVYANATLNIMDSVGGGVVEGKNNTAGGASGALYVDKGTINLYSGTVRHAEGTILNGGAVRVYGGAFNMLGGTVRGGNVTGSGGAIYVTNQDDVVGTFKASGGQITASEAEIASPCVYMGEDSKVVLSGDADIADIYFAASSAEVLEINTEDTQFTGSVQLTHATLNDNDIIGSCTSGTDLSVANVTLADEELRIVVEDTVLRAVAVKAYIYEDTTMVSEHLTLADAMENYTYDEAKRNYIKLNAAAGEIEVSEEMYLDLNGFDVEKVTVDDGCTLHVMDSMTDDYVVADADGELTGYGKIGAVSGAGETVAVGLNSVSAVGSEDAARAGYLKFVEDDGVSFHRFYQDITYYTLRTTGDGMFFYAKFCGDEMIKDAVSQFGVALTIYDLDTEQKWIEGIEDTKETGRSVLYSDFTGDDFYSGVEVQSAILNKIMDTDKGSITNARRASTRVYGRPYVMIGDQYLFGDVADDPDGNDVVDEKDDGYDFNTLKGMIMYLNDNVEGAWDALQKTENATQLTELLNMYERYPVVMNDWGADRIKEAAKAR